MLLSVGYAHFHNRVKSLYDDEPDSLRGGREKVSIPYLVGVRGGYDSLDGPLLYVLRNDQFQIYLRGEVYLVHHGVRP